MRPFEDRWVIRDADCDKLKVLTIVRTDVAGGGSILRILWKTSEGRAQKR